MAHVYTLAQTQPVHLPLGEVLPWAALPGMYIHEFVHDGRHHLGFPCH